MNDRQIKIFSLGENALTIEFGNVISDEINDQVMSLDKYLEQQNSPLIEEIFPAYSSLTIFYDLVKVRKNRPEFSTAFAAIKNLAQTAIAESVETDRTDSRLLEIPVDFSEQNAPDLAFVAQLNSLSIEEVIEIFTSRIYRVLMLGFLPGFAYLGKIDGRIAAPRKDSPRQEVPKGSVGIAGRQTGIYPFASPGGWQIIGKTEIELFDPKAEVPAFFRAGDAVKFVEIKS